MAVQFHHHRHIVRFAGAIQILQEELGGSVLQQPIVGKVGVRQHRCQQLLRTVVHHHTPGGTRRGHAVHIRADSANVSHGAAVKLSEKSLPDLQLPFDSLFIATK